MCEIIQLNHQNNIWQFLDELLGLNSITLQEYHFLGNIFKKLLPNQDIDLEKKLGFLEKISKRKETPGYLYVIAGEINRKWLLNYEIGNDLIAGFDYVEVSQSFITNENDGIHALFGYEVEPHVRKNLSSAWTYFHCILEILIS